MEPVTNFGSVKSNAFWGRRSGAVNLKTGERYFKAYQKATGSSGDNTKFNKPKTVNIPHKWAKVTYKRKK